jgi:hypothetical protein
MAVNWQSGECAAYKSAVAEYIDDADYVDQPEIWKEFIHLRDHLIWTLLVVQFPTGDWAITEKNWEDVYFRFRVYERLTQNYRQEKDPVCGSRPLYTKPDEIHSMIGLRVNAGDCTTFKFWSHIHQIAERELKVTPANRTYIESLKEATA